MTDLDPAYLRDCFSGRKLYGDDFTPDQLAQWYAEEKEGYADLYAGEGVETEYPYNAINTVHCYNHLGAGPLNRVLSIGGAYGEELIPIVSRIGHITILEPSDQLFAESLNGVPLHYVKPAVSGALPFNDNTFDLVTCFGVLHHIPNVSFVMAEIQRVLAPGGRLVFREPIVSMGDFTRHRPGLTKNERGLPKPYLDKLIRRLGFRVVNYAFCFTKPFDRLAGRLFQINVYDSPRFVLIDKVLGWLLQVNYVYHPRSTFRKLRPSCVAVVLRKA